MAEGNSLPEATVTQTVTVVQEEEAAHEPTLHLKLEKPKSEGKVKWKEGTVDNEFLGKKKSKCCCIYEKPKVFGESSSSEDDDETDSCHGHKKKCYRHHGNPGHNHDHGGEGGAGPSGSSNFNPSVSGTTPGPSAT